MHPREVERLFERSEHMDWNTPSLSGLNAMFSQAARCTEQRDIDIDPDLRQRIVSKLKHSGASVHQVEVVEHYVAMDDADRTLQFGEALPAGLVLARS